MPAGIEDPRIRGFEDSRIRGFEDSRIRGFEDSRIEDSGLRIGDPRFEDPVPRFTAHAR
jgi:hypothetical protein